MTEEIDRVTLLIKLKEAVDIMRDVRTADPASQEKIRLAVAAVESLMKQLGLARR